MKSFFLLALLALPAAARVVECDLNIDAAQWAPPGHKASPGMTINGGIPGPTLRFRVGDVARIRVHNHLREDTSVHWHGLLLPNDQDGVPGVTTPPIKAGETFTYQFPIIHAGTYWYHSHTRLQEQKGIYGSIVITPRSGETVTADRDHVVVLSDWTRESGEEVTRTLRRDSEWYEVKKGTAQSLLGAARAGALKEFFHRERDRMQPMDISDVAYDAFLANGRESSDLPAKPGETVRLRFINAGAATYFYIESATGKMRVVAADGPPVRPLPVKRLLIGMGETYDVLVTVPPSGRWEMRATAQDGSGHASVWLGQGKNHPAPDIPKPDNYRMDHMLMAAMDEKDGLMDGERPLSPYGELRSTVPTGFSEKLPRRTITLRATGDMERYIWSFNGKTFAEDGVIPIKRGEVLRLEFINDTMMHHPLHLHGHFFRVLMGQGKYSPLKHTIDVPPMGRRSVEFSAAEPGGDWIFHCHLLYHMHAGMTRIFSYQPDSWQPPADGKPAPAMAMHRMAMVPGKTTAPDLPHMPQSGGHDHDPLDFLLEGQALTNSSEGGAIFRNQRNDFYGTWDAGWRDENQYEADLGWSRYFHPNFSTDLGWRFTNGDDEENRAFAGIRYRLPYMVESRLQIDSRGDLRTVLGKSLPITQRLSGYAGVRYDTGSDWEWHTGAAWMLAKQFSLITEYDSDHGFGVGIGFRF